MLYGGRCLVKFEPNFFSGRRLDGDFRGAHCAGLFRLWFVDSSWVNEFAGDFVAVGYGDDRCCWVFEEPADLIEGEVARDTIADDRADKIVD